MHSRLSGPETVPVPLTLGCPDFVTNRNVFLQAANFTPGSCDLLAPSCESCPARWSLIDAVSVPAEVPTAYHYSGQQQSVATSALHNQDWYTATFM